MVEFEGPEKQRLLSSLRWTFHPGGENSKLPEKKIEENLGSRDLGEGNNKEKYHNQRGHEFRWIPPRRTFDPRYKNTFFGYCFSCNRFGHKAINCRTYGENTSARNKGMGFGQIQCFSLLWSYFKRL